MIIDRIPEGYEQLYWLTSRFILIFGIIGGAYVYLFYFANLTISNVFRATGIIASALLTFTLITVYRGLIVAQKKQTETLNNQEKLMEISHEPRIVIESWVGFTHFYDIGDETRSSERIRLTLSNVGEGAARDFRFGIRIEEFQEELLSENGELPRKEWERIKNKTRTTKMEEINRDNDGYESSGNFLNPDEKGVTFEIPAWVTEENKSTMAGFDTKTENLFNKYGNKEYIISMKLKWKDEKGGEHSRIFYMVKFEMISDISLKDIIEEKTEVYSFTNYDRGVFPEGQTGLIHHSSEIP